MGERKKYIAFFDLDLTLMSENSGSVLIHAGYNKGHLKRWKLLYAYYLSILYHLKLLDPRKILVIIGRWLRGFNHEMIEKIANEIFENRLKPSIYNDAISEIEMHRKNDAELVMLTSSLYSLCNPVAEYLRFDHVFCTRMVVEKTVFTGKTVDGFCYHEIKLQRLKSYCQEKEISVSEVYYYGDSMDDLPVLSAVGHPVCINPGKKLKRIAQKNGWTIKRWNN